MRKFHLYLLLITLLGLIPRIILLITRGSFWFDELFTLELAKLPFLEMLKLTLQDTNPPLYTIMQWPWIRIIPEVEWIVRLPALVLGAATVPAMGLIGKKICASVGARAAGGEKTGILAAVFTALSPLLIFFSTEARTYALWIFLTSTTLFLLFNYTQNPSSKKKLFWYSLSAILLIFSHTYAIMSAFGFYLYGIVALKKKAPAAPKIYRNPTRIMEKIKTWRWHWIHACFGLLFIVWFGYSFLPKFSILLADSWFINTRPPQGWPLNIVASAFTIQGMLPNFIYWILCAALLALVGISLRQSIAKGRANLLALIIPLFFGLIVALIFGPAKTKYYLFMIPLLILIYTHILTAKTGKKYTLPVIIALIIIMGMNTGKLITSFRFSWDRLAQFVHEENTPTIIPWAPNVLPFAYYYKGASAPLVIPAPGTTTTTLYTLHKTNWRWELPDEYVRNYMENLVPNQEKIFMVQVEPYVLSAKQWLEEHEWRLSEIKTFDDIKSVKVEIYEK